MTGARVADDRLPGYLGRVLDGDSPAGTCFQVAAGVLVTAWHVLDDIGAAAENSGVRVDPLGGGDAFGALVIRVDPVHDLAVLTSSTALPASAEPLTATDRMALRAGVTVSGYCVVDDSGRTARSLTTVGQWAGPAMWDDAVPVGRMTSDALMPGMSGAPVVRDADQAVAGVVSGRYNSADGWLAGTVWVARTEDLLPLLDGITEITVAEPPLAGPVDLLLTVTADQVRLTGPGTDVTAGHRRVSPGLAQAVDEARRARARAGQVLDPQSQAAGQGGEEFSLARAGRLLGESFLPEPVATELQRMLELATRAYQPVRLGIAAPPELIGLPWEALPGPGGGPLTLDPLVRLYRKTEAGPVRVLPGPLRIVVAIASPDDSHGGLVDYERHLRSVIAAVRSARQGNADVQVVPFATTAAIRAELDRAPAHVLHIYCHGQPGQLELEDDKGSARLVSAAEFAAEAIPPGAMPPVISLSACYTDTATAEDAPSFAAALCARGAAAVIGTETSVTDIYATRLFARVYGALAASRVPDVIAALADARREVQRELEASPDRGANQLGGLAEWAVVTILSRSAAVVVLDPNAARAEVRPPEPPRIAGLAARGPWYFVGRRAEQRRWPAELAGSGAAGMVICGIGGTGKTTLAAELTARIRYREPGRILVSATGQLTLEGLLSTVTSAVRRELLVRGRDGDVIRALDVAARPDLGWADRLAILRGHVLDRVPMLVVLDNFEDNLRPEGAGWAVADEVLAGLLAALVTDPGASRLLVTSRHPFTLPGGADRALWFRQLGALSRAETMKLAWSLPALDRLDEAQLETVWRLAGGHPRSLEYLDALLAGGTALYPDVTARLDAAITARLKGAEKQAWLAARTGLDAALAETVALAADDVLLDDLLTRLAAVPCTADLLTGVAVYREPVDYNAVLFTAGQPDPTAANIPDRAAAYQRIGEILAAAGIPAGGSIDLARVSHEVQAELDPYLTELDRLPVPPFRAGPELAAQVSACQAAGLVTVTMTGPGQQFFVHRWTATELAARQPAPELAAAHRQAAAYWQWRYRTWPQDQASDVHDLLEARHHLLAAGDTGDATQVTWPICEQLDTWGAWDQETTLIHDTLARMPDGSADQARWLRQLGLVTGQHGDYDQAERHYQHALNISERVADQAGMALSYHRLGILAQHRGDYDQAERHYQHATDTYERLGNQTGMAHSYGQLGTLTQLRGDHDQAERHYQHALNIFERLGHQVGMATSYHNLGVLAQERGDNDQAVRQYQHALDIRERLGDQPGIADSYHQLGTLAQHRGDHDQAERHYQHALNIFERLGHQANMASSYHNLGILAQERGDNDQATRQYQRALDIEERLGDQPGIADSYHQLGTLAQHRGDYDQAERHYQHALNIFERLGHQADQAATISQLGILDAERGAPPAAVIARHVTALAIRLRLGGPQPKIDLRRLAACREDLGPEQFTALLTQATGDTGQIQTIMSLLGQFDADAALGQRDQAEEKPSR